MSQDIITTGGYRFVTFWAIGVSLLFAIAGYLGVSRLQDYKMQTLQQRQEWLAADNTGVAGKVTAAKAQAPADVRVGLFVTHIGEFGLKEDSWSANFDIWFRWAGKTVSPGETFWLVNGEIQSREKREAYDVGGERYERYHVKARVSKYFDPTRFPLADEPLTLVIEDAIHPAETLRFVADTQDSRIAANAILRTVKVSQSVLAVKTHHYESNLGDPRRTDGNPRAYSRVVFAMLVTHPGGMFHFKLYHALFVGVAISLLAFFIKPTHVDPRFGLPVGAAFTAVANIISNAALLPRAEGYTLNDMMNTVGMITILLTLVQSAISLYFFDTVGKEKLSRFFDHVSFVVFFVSYVALNVALAWAAGR